MINCSIRVKKKKNIGHTGLKDSHAKSCVGVREARVKRETYLFD